MTLKKTFDAMSDNERMLGRRGMLSTVAPAMLLLVTETFANEPPIMSLLTTEDFSNNPPNSSLLTTEDFSNNPPNSSLLTQEEFGGYFWNPNALLHAHKDSAQGQNIQVTMTLEQESAPNVWSVVKSTPFGTILDLSYPARQHRVTVPATYIENGIIYDAVTVTLTYSGSYTERLDFAFVYTRRAGQ